MRLMVGGREVTGDRIKNAYVLFNMRQGRGSGLISRFQTYIVFVASIKILFPSSNILMLAIIGVPLWLVGTYHLGLWDEKKIKLWQLENEKAQTHVVNPYFIRLESKIDNLLKKVSK